MPIVIDTDPVSTAIAIDRKRRARHGPWRLFPVRGGWERARLARANTKRMEGVRALRATPAAASRCFIVVFPCHCVARRIRGSVVSTANIENVETSSNDDQ